MGNFENGKLYSWREKKNLGSINDESINAPFEQKKIINVPGEDLFTIKTDSTEADLRSRRRLIENRVNESFSVFSKKSALLKNGKYVYLDEKGKEHKGSSWPSFWYMRPVIKSLEKLDTLFDKKIDLKDRGKIENAFLKASVACENYLESRKAPSSDDGKARRQMVMDFYEQIRWESMRFSETIEKLINGEYEMGPGAKWIDVLGKVRTTFYDNGVEDIKISKTGGAISEVFVINNTSTGEKKYFKRHDKVPKDSYKETLEREKARLDQEVSVLKSFGASEEEIKQASERNRERLKVVELLQDAFDVMYSDNPGGLADAIETIKAGYKKKTESEMRFILLNWLKETYKDLNDGEFVQEIEEIEAEYENVTKQYNATKDPAKKKAGREGRRNYIIDVLNKIEKDHVGAVIAHRDAMIRDEDSELTKRNVATSRLAKILGVEDIVVKSVMTEVTINGITMKGVLMDDAGGEFITNVSRRAVDKKKTLRYSPNALKQIANLQLLDILCGQVDRHNSNYLVTSHEEKTEIYVDKVVGIDNDMAFGSLAYADILKKGARGLNRLKNFEDFDKLVLPYLDQAVVGAIKALDPKVVSYQMADILTKIERECLEDRIKGVKRRLERVTNNQKTKNAVISGGDDAWDDAGYAMKKLPYDYLKFYTYYEPELLGVYPKKKESDAKITD